MGQHTEKMARTWEIPRADQDALALASHEHAQRAWNEGFFADLVVPYLGLTADNNVRADSSLEKLSKLKPSFAKDGTLTAGNSTPLTDGCGRGAARLRGLGALARPADPGVPQLRQGGRGGLRRRRGAPDGAGIHRAAHAGGRGTQAPGLRLLRDPRGFRRAGALHAEGLGVGEVLPRAARPCGRPLGSIDRAKLNVKGGSVAVGHPFAATGARIVGTLAKLLATRGSGRGLISVCTAGGMGVTAIMER